MKPIPPRARPLLQTDLFDAVAASMPLANLQQHYDAPRTTEPVPVAGGKPRETLPNDWRMTMTKISSEHLARGAYVYVRQPTADQLRNNHESRRRQYALGGRARALG